LFVFLFNSGSAKPFAQDTATQGSGVSCYTPYGEIGIDKSEYKDLFSDGKITDRERELLYRNYYTKSPRVMRITGTLYGSNINAIAEILKYGSWIRQQMGRGWVLIGSGEYGYHSELRRELGLFIKKYYGYKNPDDILLQEQKSPLYFYFADGGMKLDNRDVEGQPIPVTYEELNARQKRVYDITVHSPGKMEDEFFVGIDEQSGLTPEQALASGKYIGVVSTKSVNDFGRRFLLYDCKSGNAEFLGVVLVGGEARLTDWTGLGNTTFKTFDFNHFPLITRTANGYHWGMDLPTAIYEKLGGTGGPTRAFLAIDPDPAYNPPIETRYLFDGAAEYGRYKEQDTTYHIMKMDLDRVGLFITPNVQGVMQTDNFLRLYGLQIAINGDGFFTDKSGRLVLPGFYSSLGRTYGNLGGSQVLYFDKRNNVSMVFPGYKNVWNAISFSNMLIRDGKKIDNHRYDIDPRTALGVTKDNELILLVVDGKETYGQPGRSGMSLDEISDILIEQDVILGVNMDGGGSSTLVIEDNGKPLIFNTPCGENNSGLRSVATHIGIYIR